MRPRPPPPRRSRPSRGSRRIPRAVPPCTIRPPPDLRTVQSPSTRGCPPRSQCSSGTGGSART
ncbi:hypothetical protein K438DRAFT_1856767 [Mycena galopus ATCC 62051]|nr:hypothetical protein K438DRAFT_1856767 [Mycena galopus ATCC 62051]